MPRKSIFNMGKSTSEIDALASLGQRLIDLVAKFDDGQVVVRRRRRRRKEETFADIPNIAAKETEKQFTLPAGTLTGKKRRAKRRGKAVARVPRKARKEVVAVDVSPSE